MPGYYEESSEAEEIAKKLIPTFNWIDMPNIKFMEYIATKSTYLGKCSLANAKWKKLTGADYIIEVFSGFWDEAEDNEKEALIFHELSHIEAKEDKEGEIKWRIKKHDCEEFLQTAKNYGAWNITLQAMGTLLSKDKSAVVSNTVDENFSNARG